MKEPLGIRENPTGHVSVADTKQSVPKRPVPAGHEAVNVSPVDVFIQVTEFATRTYKEGQTGRVLH